MRDIWWWLMKHVLFAGRGHHYRPAQTCSSGTVRERHLTGKTWDLEPPLHPHLREEKCVGAL